MSWSRPPAPFAAGGGLFAEPRAPGAGQPPSDGDAGGDPGGAGRPPRRPRRRVALALGVVVALVVGVLVFVAVRSPSSDTAAPPRAAPTTTTAPLDSAVVYQHILPSLVLVRAHDLADPGDEVLGSGVIVNAAGQILTANHVVSDASNIEVTFADGTTSSATVGSTSPETDIAVLVPDHGPSVIVPAVLAGGALKIGDPTFSAGNPLGLTGSFTAGVISGLDRTVPLPDGSGSLQGVIQFDAAVNPGSSGGPLLNGRGQVIGIITGVANPTNEGVFIGIGFAVPIQTAGGAANAPPR